MAATLFIVATPIGNLADLSFRAVETLKNADIIAAEDTRHSSKLLQHYHISTQLIPYHDHSDENQTRRIIEKLQHGDSVALISDAGTPLISDPGYKLVREARAVGVKVVPIPGACALIAALCAAGLPTDRFSFEGFPPAKSVARQNMYKSLLGCGQTLVFYESPHRISESLQDMYEVFGADRKAVLARELSKTYETFVCGTLAELLAELQVNANQSRGEMVVLLEGAGEGVSSEQQEAVVHTMKTLMEELPLKQAASLAAKITGEKKNILYQWGLDYKKSLD